MLPCAARGRFVVNTSHENLYEEHILGHFDEPYHRGRLEEPTLRGTGQNPLCGDQVWFDISVEPDGRISEAFFEARGCVISEAAASILCEYIEGKSVRDMERMREEKMLQLLKVRLTARRQECGLLAFRTVVPMIRSYYGTLKISSGS